MSRVTVHSPVKTVKLNPFAPFVFCQICFPGEIFCVNFHAMSVVHSQVKTVKVNLHAMWHLSLVAIFLPDNKQHLINV